MYESIHVRITKEQYEWLRRYCYENRAAQAEVIREALELFRQKKEGQNMAGGFRCFGCDYDYTEGYWLEIRGEEPYFYCPECAEKANIIGRPGVYEHGPNTVVEVVVLETTETVESADGHRFQNFETVERFQLVIPVGDPKTAVRIAIDEVGARGYNVIPNDQGGCNEYVSVSGGEDYIAVTVQPK